MNDLGVYIVGFAVWIGVVAFAVKRREHLTSLALVLIVTGLLGSGLLSQMGVRSASAWAFLAVGVVLIILMATLIPKPNEEEDERKAAKHLRQQGWTATDPTEDECAAALLRARGWTLIEPKAELVEEA